MKKLDADMSVIADSAGKLKTLTDEYTGAYREIFKQLRVIDSSWDGVDNDEFNKKFNFLEKDFFEMTIFLEKAVNHLKLSGESYTTVGNAISRRADRLNKISSSKSSKASAGHGSSGGGGGSW